ncbi:PREDICTED: uncharacterized protein LOC104157280 [Cariama cristata]|uniref:uncharacterized protein LOC104157280 n=1 Tax=Cariama cristata TaxID=54380 RepID=UPI000520C8EE|nr:PREDICTED: uncharacterized protein LOC104157280 [Cariama cristata]
MRREPSASRFHTNGGVQRQMCADDGGPTQGPGLPDPPRAEIPALEMGCFQLFLPGEATTVKEELACLSLQHVGCLAAPLESTLFPASHPRALSPWAGFAETVSFPVTSAMSDLVKGASPTEVMQLLGKIETSNSDQSSNLKAVQGDQHHELQLLDFKLTSILSDFRDQIQTHRKWTEAQLTRSVEDQAQHRHQLLTSVKERLERAEKRVEEKLLLLSLKLEQMDKPQKYEKQLNQMRSDEKNLHARITRFERQIWKELEEIQDEYKSGFQSIHESLELLTQIQNTKLKLEKKKIQKDMKKIQKAGFSKPWTSGGFSEKPDLHSVTAETELAQSVGNATSAVNDVAPASRNFGTWLLVKQQLVQLGISASPPSTLDAVVPSTSRNSKMVKYKVIDEGVSKST